MAFWDGKIYEYDDAPVFPSAGCGALGSSKGLSYIWQMDDYENDPSFYKCTIDASKTETINETSTRPLSYFTNTVDYPSTLENGVSTYFVDTTNITCNIISTSLYRGEPIIGRFRVHEVNYELIETAPAGYGFLRTTTRDTFTWRLYFRCSSGYPTPPEDWEWDENKNLTPSPVQLGYSLNFTGVGSTKTLNYEQVYTPVNIISCCDHVPKDFKKWEDNLPQLIAPNRRNT